MKLRSKSQSYCTYIFTLHNPCGRSPGCCTLWRFHWAGELSHVKQRTLSTDRREGTNHYTTGVGVGTRTIYPVHICGTLPPPQMRQLCYSNLCRAAPCSVRALSPLLGWKAPRLWWPQSSAAMPDWAYFGWACPNKHTETLQPQLRASPWLTSSPVTLPLREKRGEKTSEEERDK